MKLRMGLFDILALMHANKVINEQGETEKAGCVVLNDKQELLLVTNAKRDVWGLPKGHAETGETPEEVATRETLEETGYEVVIIKPLGDMVYNNGKTGEPIRVHYFLAKPLERTGETEEPWQWVSLAKAKELVMPNVKDFLEKVLG